MSWAIGVKIKMKIKKKGNEIRVCKIENLPKQSGTLVLSQLVGGGLLKTIKSLVLWFLFWGLGFGLDWVWDFASFFFFLYLYFIGGVYIPNFSPPQTSFVCFDWRDWEAINFALGLLLSEFWNAFFPTDALPIIYGFIFESIGFLRHEKFTI